jgi:hypothetical protein
MGASVMATGLPFASAGDQKEGKDIIELREYELAFGSNQSVFHTYIREALIPALNKNGVPDVGVFSELANSEPPKIYVLIPYPVMEYYFTIPSLLLKDNDYLSASSEYFNLSPDIKAFNRFTTRLMISFDGVPRVNANFNGSGIYELRTYEGYNEDAVRRKIKMFNEAELNIFKNNGLNSVFFGEVLAGPDLPCLTYMVAFKDMAERNQVWQKFGADPEWNRIKDLPEYANSVSNIIKKFLEPLPYSQI